jgi:hypothetical protein
VQNRKAGWTKRRSALAQWFSGYYRTAYVEQVVMETATPISAMAPLPYADASGFSSQLMNLRASLGAAGTAPATEPMVEFARKYAYASEASSGHGAV